MVVVQNHQEEENKSTQDGAILQYGAKYGAWR